MSECRLSVSKSVKTKLLEKIDAEKFLALSNDQCERAELFLFALSLGVASKAKSDRATSVSLVRPASLKQSWKSLLYMSYLASLDAIEKGVQAISEDEEPVGYCNKVADVGFSELENMMEMDFDTAVEELTSELNDKYERFRTKYPELKLPALEAE